MTRGNIVLDASVVADGLIGKGEEGSRAREYLDHPRAYVPELLFAEVGAVLKREERKSGAVVDQKFQTLLSYGWKSVPFEVFGPLSWRHRHHVSMYDACYLALSIVLSATLVTNDKRLARAASRYCDVLILWVEGEAGYQPG